MLVAGGFTDRRTAQELCLSERTVTTHVSRILKKLGICSRDKIADLLA
jgi:DNA-binding NarL/FixJ family response regulator